MLELTLTPTAWLQLAEGVLGTVEELMFSVGERVSEDEARCCQLCHGASRLAANVWCAAPAQVVAVVETDKVSLDVKATASGVISAVCVEVGDSVKERQPLYQLEG